MSERLFCLKCQCRVDAETRQSFDWYSWWCEQCGTLIDEIHADDPDDAIGYLAGRDMLASPDDEPSEISVSEWIAMTTPHTNPEPTP